VLNFALKRSQYLGYMDFLKMQFSLPSDIHSDITNILYEQKPDATKQLEQLVSAGPNSGISSNTNARIYKYYDSLIKKDGIITSGDFGEIITFDKEIMCDITNELTDINDDNFKKVLADIVRGKYRKNNNSALWYFLGEVDIPFDKSIEFHHLSNALQWVACLYEQVEKGMTFTLEPALLFWYNIRLEENEYLRILLYEHSLKKRYRISPAYSDKGFYHAIMHHFLMNAPIPVNHSGLNFKTLIQSIPIQYRRSFWENTIFELFREKEISDSIIKRLAFELTFLRKSDIRAIEKFAVRKFEDKIFYPDTMLYRQYARQARNISYSSIELVLFRLNYEINLAMGINA